MKQKLKAHFGIPLNSDTKLHVSEGNLVNKGEKLISFPTVEVKVYSDPKLKKLSSQVLDQINQELKGKTVKKNDTLYKSKGLFSTIILVPQDGIFLGIDEFGNIQIELSNNEEKEVKSPVKAIVSKIDDEKITLEFDAVEFKGEGLIEGKAWGDTDLKIIDKLVDLNYEYDGNVILSREISQTFLTKAEVLGVTAVITDNKEIAQNNLDTNLPILFLENNEWNELFEYGGEKRQVLLNSKSGRLLIVIE